MLRINYFLKTFKFINNFSMYNKLKFWMYVLLNYLFNFFESSLLYELNISNNISICSKKNQSLVLKIWFFFHTKFLFILKVWYKNIFLESFSTYGGSKIYVIFFSINFKIWSRNKNQKSITKTHKTLIFYRLWTPWNL